MQDTPVPPPILFPKVFLMEHQALGCLGSHAGGVGAFDLGMLRPGWGGEARGACAESEQLPEIGRG